MVNENDIFKKNEQQWNENVEKGDQYTQSWLNLDIGMIKKMAAGLISDFHEPYGELTPDSKISKIYKILFGNLKGKNVLCLASGGGQQSVIFGMLGANVTVLDICEKQLASDKKAADHYGYPINTIKGNMTDLSVFTNDYFDIVFQPISICFVSDISIVYKEVYRVLKKGGLYKVAHINPSTYPTAFENVKDGWDGIGYRIAQPYVGGPIKKDKDGNENMENGELTGEFRHLFVDIFCELTDAGFNIKYVWEDPRHFFSQGTHQPGSFLHELSVVQKYINILSIK